MLTQLTLPILSVEQNTFDNFYVGVHNQVLINCLQRFTLGRGETYVYLWGHSGVGCTHLLQACCRQGQQQGLSTVYCAWPSVRNENRIIDILASLEARDMVCIDNLDSITGKGSTEEAFLYFYNRLLSKGGYLLIAAKNVPSQLTLSLSDLSSRLASGILFQVHELTDAEKLIALQQRAQLRGFGLSKEVGQFLLTHGPRSASALFGSLAKLETASLILQRKLTVPLVKSVLGL